ncbi:MAG: hypothetical protein JNJ98_00470 [Gemmatimonadetes bacterium]|nr:hypothetical protein [Gemmatimonadota bacterium]
MTEPTAGRDPRVRNIVSVGAGVFVGVILLVVLQAANGMAFPPPPGTDPNDPESMRRAMAAMTTPAYVGLIAGYLIATTVACTLAARLAGTDPSRRARLVGLAFIVAGIMNFRAIPHPGWVVVATLAAFVSAMVLGPRLAGRVS